MRRQLADFAESIEDLRREIGEIVHEPLTEWERQYLVPVVARLMEIEATFKALSVHVSESEG